MLRKPKYPPKLLKMYELGEKGETIKLVLKDGRKVECKLDMITYANDPEDEDKDILVASVDYPGDWGELLTEDDIVEVLNESVSNNRR
ncbi:MAG: hypothetical protein ACI4EF_06095 [Coprococcus sp.]